MKHLGWMAALVFVVPVTARAEKVLSGGDLTLNVGALLQPETQIAEDAAPNKSTGTDFFLRRARLVVSGSLTRQVDFFIDTEQANLGKGGTTGNVSLLDAFGTFKIAPPIAIDGGLMLVPLTRHALQSAISLNGIDYHSKLILYPPNSNFIWRDLGIEARGLLAGGHLHYRAGIFAGVHGTEPTMMMPIARNQSDIPRVAGHVRWNFLGKEETFFFPGISFATEPLLSFGVGADYQPNAVAAMTRANDYLALASDVFAEIPTKGESQELVFQGTFFRYDQGPDAAGTGIGGFVETGYRINWFEPTVAYEQFSTDHNPAGDYRAIHGGIAGFYEKHKANLKADLALAKQGTAGNLVSFLLQAQLSL